MGFQPKYAIDEDFATIFHSESSNPSNEWWEIDLGTIYHITKIRVSVWQDFENRLQYLKVMSTVFKLPINLYWILGLF